MQFVRSLLFNVFVRLGTYICYFICAPFLLFGRRGALLGCTIWAYYVVYATKYIAGIDYVVVGKNPEHAVIFACKHQSAWETAIFFLISKAPVYCYKKELAYIPFFNLFMYFNGNIMVDRKGGAKTLKHLIKKTRERIAQNRSVVIFPEGTRKEYGAAPDYKAGIAALYNSVEADVVPVSLNSGKFWPRNSFLKTPGTITVNFLEPMPKGLSKKEFMIELEKRIEQAVE